jgi:Flp pilus assembly protein TadG
VVKSERGSQLVELVIAFSLLTLLLAGIVDVGGAFSTYMGLANAAREGARMASRLPCLAGDPAQQDIVKARILAAAQGEFSGVLDPRVAAIEVTIEPDPVEDNCGGGDFWRGNTVVVTARTNMSTFLGGILGTNTIPLSATNRMVIFGNEGP